MTESCAFVIPFWSNADGDRQSYLVETVRALCRQTDEDWYAIVVDDGSIGFDHDTFFRDLASIAAGKVEVIRLSENRGPGIARNRGAARAAELGIQIICWLDADDLPHPDRVSHVKRCFRENPSVDLAYTDIEIIDECGANVSSESLSPSLRRMVEDIRYRPLAGFEVWKTMATDRGILSIPSSISTRTSLALTVPYPPGRYCEDIHVQLRYSALGARVAWIPETTTQYRLLMGASSSASRQMARSVSAYNRRKFLVDRHGVRCAIAMAMSRAEISESEAGTVIDGFYKGLSGFAASEGDTGLLALIESERDRSVDLKEILAMKRRFTLRELAALTDVDQSTEVE